MKKNLIRYLIVIAFTASAAVMVIWANRIAPIENKRFYDFPMLIGQWHGQEIPMGDYVYKSLETKYALLRNYVSSNERLPVNLSIVWFDDKNIAFHAPEACLGGVGNYVKIKTTTPISLDRQYNVGKLIVEQNGMRQIVLYFYDEDGFITMSQSALRLRVLLKRFQFKRSSVSFIRLMIPENDNEAEAMHVLQEFVKTLYPFIPYYTYTDKIAETNNEGSGNGK
jgi:EpsI family protein